MADPQAVNSEGNIFFNIQNEASGSTFDTTDDTERPNDSEQINQVQNLDRTSSTEPYDQGPHVSRSNQSDMERDPTGAR